MPSDESSNHLAKVSLEKAIEQLESEAQDARFNVLSIQAVGNAAKLLGHDGIAERACELLREAPDAAFLAGVISNIELSGTFITRMRALDPVERLEKQHPLCYTASLVEQIRSYAATEQHFALCLEGRIQEARQVAGSGRRLEEVGDALAILGRFDDALSIASDQSLEKARQQGIRFVVMVELFRLGRFEEATAFGEKWSLVNLGAWERVHTALALAGRAPWGGYPFPDW